MNDQDVLIKLDIDGVIRNWNESLITTYQKYCTGRVIYPFTDFNIKSSFPDIPDIFHFFKSHAADEIYRNAKPYEGAIEFVELLLSRFSNVWLVTTQFPNTTFPTIEWIQAYVPSHINLPILFSKEKGLIGKSRFEHTLLIDDAPHNLINQVDAGGTAICFGQLYNFAKPQYNTWINFFGGTDFSIEAEPERLKKQYQMILDYLDDIL